MAKDNNIITIGIEPEERFSGIKDVEITKVTKEQSDAFWAERKAAAWSDNADYANKINGLIIEEVCSLSSDVNKAVKVSHDKFGLTELLVELSGNPLSLSTFSEYEKTLNNYEEWMLNRDHGHREKEKLGGIAHPSKTITDKLRDHLIERGFHWNTLGWFDPNGASIRYSEWVEFKPDHSVVDPAGIFVLESEYDEMFKQIKSIVE